MRLLSDAQAQLLRDVKKDLADTRLALAELDAPREALGVLQQAIQQLDELFLIVVVGEFNAGKSALLNALLGERVMAEGVTPTTARVTLVKWGEQISETITDETFATYTHPLALLRELNIVDTPGTNAVIRQHERLTNEFVPRSDLVLFVTSADRPLTESERQFLEHIREWGKKVVLILNKVDLFDQPGQLEEVRAFVLPHAARVLGAPPEFFPVSARLAQKARETADLAEKRRVVFLGDKVSDFLFGEGADPVGESLLLNGVPFRVIGVLRAKIQNSSYNTRDQVRAFIPSTTYEGMFGERYLNALRALHALGLEPPLAPVFLVNTDEEIGSVESRPVIEQLAQQAARALILEPSAGPDGALKTARKGVGDFEIVVHGRAAHAGLEPEKGVSAILGMAEIVRSLATLNDYPRGVSVSVGLISGGLRSNVVAPECRAVVDVRATTVADAERLTQAIRALPPPLPGTSLTIHGGFDRAPLERTPRNAALWELARAAGAELGLALTETAVGGGSDGNLTSPFTATLDGLGPVGDGAHARHEHVLISKMVERSALLALLLMKGVSEQ